MALTPRRSALGVAERAQLAGLHQPVTGSGAGEVLRPFVSNEDLFPVGYPTGPSSDSQDDPPA